MKDLLGALQKREGRKELIILEQFASFTQKIPILWNVSVNIINLDTITEYVPTKSSFDLFL